MRTNYLKISFSALLLFLLFWLSPLPSTLSQPLLTPRPLPTPRPQPMGLPQFTLMSHQPMTTPMLLLMTTTV